MPSGLLYMPGYPFKCGGAQSGPFSAVDLVPAEQLILALHGSYMRQTCIGAEGISVVNEHAAPVSPGLFRCMAHTAIAQPFVGLCSAMSAFTADGHFSFAEARDNEIAPMRIAGTRDQVVCYAPAFLSLSSRDALDIAFRPALRTVVSLGYWYPQMMAQNVSGLISTLCRISTRGIMRINIRLGQANT